MAWALAGRGSGPCRSGHQEQIGRTGLLARGGQHRVDLATVIKLSTETAGLALQRPELGTLKPGVPGDATVLSLDEGEWIYEDVLGETMTGSQRLHARGVVLGGAWWHPA